MKPLRIREMEAEVRAFELAERKKSKREHRAKMDPVKRDRGREQEPPYLAFVRRQPCAAAHVGGCSGPIQAAHIRYRDARYPNSAATGVKNHDRWASPLCAAHHALQHHVGDERRFWDSIGKGAYATAAEHYAAYRSGT